MNSYQNAAPPAYVKLLDGGLTDNIGVTGFTLSRASAQTPFGPLAPDEAVKLNTLMFLVVDAGRDNNVTWDKSLYGPTLPTLIAAISNTGITASVRDEFDALRLAVTNWRSELVAYRCGLPIATVRQILGSSAGWDCRDVELIVQRLSFGDLDRGAGKGEQRRHPAETAGGRRRRDHRRGAPRVRGNADFQAAVARIRSRAGVGSAPRLASAAN